MCTKPNNPRPLRWFSLAIFAQLAMVFAASAEITRTQTLPLQRGWNAVFLEVIPKRTAPTNVFAGLPVDIVAAFLKTESSVQFLKDPARIGWKKEGWGVWYEASRPDAFLSTLHAIDGNRAYLIHAERDCTWTIEGTVLLEPMRWKSDSFNFAGFCLDPQSPPTFEKFFSGSKAHRHLRVYRLTSEHWTLVTNPTGTVMRAGEAYWVHSRGASDYQGPLSVKLSAGTQLRLGEKDAAPIVLANHSSDPASVRVETVCTDGGIPLSYVVRVLSDGRMDDVPFDLPASHSFTTLEPGGKTALRLKVRAEHMHSARQSTLLKFTTDSGARVWVPAVAQRADLSANP